MSKFTGAGRNGRNDADSKYDYLAATHNMSILFTWVPIEIYNDKEKFADRLFLLMLFVNVWHFFIRKWSFPKCFENLIKSFDFKRN